MKKVLFVCLGNICRSPMAEFMFKKYVEEKGEGGNFVIESAATSSEEIGNPVYPPAKRELAKHGISCEGKRARRLAEKDFSDFDLIVCMDENNLRSIERYFGSKSVQKVRKMMSFAGSSQDVADPWYTGNFEKTYKDIESALDGLYSYLS